MKYEESYKWDIVWRQVKINRNICPLISDQRIQRQNLHRHPWVLRRQKYNGDKARKKGHFSQLWTVSKVEDTHFRNRPEATLINFWSHSILCTNKFILLNLCKAILLSNAMSFVFIFIIYLPKVIMIQVQTSLKYPAG